MKTLTKFFALAVATCVLLTQCEVYRVAGRLGITDQETGATAEIEVATSSAGSK